MRGKNDRQWEYHFQRVNDGFSWGHACGRTRPLGAQDSPFGGHERHREHNNGRYGEDGDNKGDTEATENLGDFQEKVTAFDFLLRCAPFCQKSRSRGGPGRYEKGLTDVVAEHVREEGLVEVNRKTTEEDQAWRSWLVKRRGYRSECTYKNGM